MVTKIVRQELFIYNISCIITISVYFQIVLQTCYRCLEVALALIPSSSFITLYSSPKFCLHTSCLLSNLLFVPMSTPSSTVCVCVFLIQLGQLTLLACVSSSFSSDHVLSPVLAANSGLNSDSHFVLASSGQRGLHFRAKLSVFSDQSAVVMATALALPKQREVIVGCRKTQFRPTRGPSDGICMIQLRNGCVYQHVGLSELNLTELNLDQYRGWRSPSEYVKTLFKIDCVHISLKISQ